MDEKNFKRIFGLGDSITIPEINKCLAAGMLMGAAAEITARAKACNPRLTRDLCQQHIFKNVGKNFPGLSEKFTPEQAKTLDNLLNQNMQLLSDWK